MIAPTPNRVEVLSRAVFSGGSFSPVAPDPAEVLYAQIGSSPGGKSGDAPRIRAAVWLRIPHDALAGAFPGPGSLLDVDGADYEVCESPARIMQGVRPVGWEAHVVPVAEAYPTAVAVLDAGGDTVAEANIAMWAPKESVDGRGEREEKEGEAPYALYPMLVVRNAVVMVGDQKWRVVSCALDVDAARVDLRLRNTRGGE